MNIIAKFIFASIAILFSISSFAGEGAIESLFYPSQPILIGTYNKWVIMYSLIIKFIFISILFTGSYTRKLVALFTTKLITYITAIIIFAPLCIISREVLELPYSLHYTIIQFLLACVVYSSAEYLMYCKVFKLTSPLKYKFFNLVLANILTIGLAVVGG